MFPGSPVSPFRWQLGYQAQCLTRGFASPPHSGFAVVGEGVFRRLLHRQEQPPCQSQRRDPACQKRS